MTDTAKTDYYKVLGVDRDCPQNCLAPAYRLAALRAHPDRGGDNAAMAELNAAMEVLSNPTSRATYDLTILSTAERAFCELLKECTKAPDFLVDPQQTLNNKLDSIRRLADATKVATLQHIARLTDALALCDSPLWQLPLRAELTAVEASLAELDRQREDIPKVRQLIATLNMHSEHL